MVGNFGQEWEIGIVDTKTPYRAGEKSAIQARIGLKIGLRSVNITLQGEGEAGTPLEKEIINYNERFPWTWDQGRFGFGPYAGRLQRHFREAQRKGLPSPIISIVDYLVVDGEGLRFGRFYRTAGWYTHILLWATLPAWIFANIFLQTVGRYAAYFIALIGVFQLLACAIWSIVRNPIPLVIPFEDGVISTHFGPHYWMTLACGIFCLALASTIVFMDLRYPNMLSVFLGLDPLNQYDEYVVRASEMERIRDQMKVTSTLELRNMEGDSSQNQETGMMILKRRSTVRMAQKNLFRTPVPVQIDDYDDIGFYANQNVTTSQGPQSSTLTKKTSMEESTMAKPPLPAKNRIKKQRDPDKVVKV
ncbi:dual oxidase maturation factor 1 isoform X2 [Orussus abietinus]|nr:dual oxidase maturation factor 1 isoform X2 [Orussus abietinus]